MNEMSRCPYGKKGRHDLAVVFHSEDADIPITLLCIVCGSAKQYQMRTWAGGSLDDLTPQEIKAAVDGNP